MVSFTKLVGVKFRLLFESSDQSKLLYSLFKLFIFYLQNSQNDKTYFEFLKISSKIILKLKRISKVNRFLKTANLIFLGEMKNQIALGRPNQLVHIFNFLLL